jgi:hypothetical protein
MVVGDPVSSSKERREIAADIPGVDTLQHADDDNLVPS